MIFFLQLDLDEAKFQPNPINYASVISSPKTFQYNRNVNLGSAGSSPCTPPSCYMPSRSFRSTSLRLVPTLYLFIFYLMSVNSLMNLYVKI